MVLGRPRRGTRFEAVVVAAPFLDTAEEAAETMLEETEMTLDADGLGERVIDRVTLDPAFDSATGGAVAAMLRFRLRVPPML